MTLTTLTDAIWSALQRPSPSVTKEEINEIVSAWHDKLGAMDNATAERLAQTASETPYSQWTPEQCQAVEIQQYRIHSGEYPHNEVQVGGYSVGNMSARDIRRWQATPEHALVHQYFEGALPNQVTASAMEEARLGGLPKFKTTVELLDDLDD